MTKIELLDFIKSLGIEYGIKEGDTEVIERLKKCNHNDGEDIDYPDNTVINGIKCIHADRFKYYINALDNNDNVIYTHYNDSYSTLRHLITYNGKVLFEKITDKVSVELFEKIVEKVQSNNYILKVCNLTRENIDHYNEYYYGVNYSSFHKLDDCTVCIRNSQDNVITLVIDGEDIIFCDTIDEHYPRLRSLDESEIKSIYDHLKTLGYIDWRLQ